MADDRDELSLEELEEAAGGLEGSNTNCATSCGNTNCVAGCTGGAATKDPAAG
jgi:hypothetical protein